MGTIAENNTSIAKNTLFLYFRMFIMMAVSLYTSRVILRTLGVEDFGIYNVVAGIVILFSFVNGAMSIATQRFISFALGENDSKKVERVFSMSVTSHIVIAVLIIFIGESIGLLILHQMNFPHDRLYAVEWTYQLAIITCCLKVLRVPYNASIISFEKMSFYAIISIVEVILNLLVIFVVYFCAVDKLILYSLMLMLLTLIINVFYVSFCVKTFSSCKYSFVWDPNLFKKFIGFTSWSMLGSIASLSSQQGLNMILNIFCGVFVNAAVGVSNQVMAAFSTFMSNFQTAFNPQLIKSYARGDSFYLTNLIIRSSKCSYFLLLIVSIPIIIYCEFFLNIWLDEVPKYALEFSQLMIIFVLLESLSGPLWISVQATGHIKYYQIFVSIIIFLNIPVALFLMYLGASPIYVYVSRVCFNVLLLIFRIVYLNKILSFPFELFLKKVILVTIKVTVLSLPIPFYLSRCLSISWVNVLFVLFISIIITTYIIFMVGLDNNERKNIKILLTKKIFSKIK